MSTKLCRCTSCGYLHPHTDPGALYEAEAGPVAIAAVEPVRTNNPPVIQPTACPLCREVFTDPVLYDEHRARNCAPAPAGEPVAPVTDPAAGGVTDVSGGTT